MEKVALAVKRIPQERYGNQVEEMVERCRERNWTIAGKAIVLCRDDIDEILIYLRQQQVTRVLISSFRYLSSSISEAIFIITCLYREGIALHVVDWNRNTVNVQTGEMTEFGNFLRRVLRETDLLQKAATKGRTRGKRRIKSTKKLS